MKNKRLYIIIIVIAIVLLIPLVAMQFSTEVNWSLFDFIVAGILLLCTGFAVEFVMRKTQNNKLRIVLIIVIFIILLLVWAELAVGIFGTPFAGS